MVGAVRVKVGRGEGGEPTGTTVAGGGGATETTVAEGGTATTVAP